MAVTLESLQTRVVKLEQEIASLRQMLLGTATEETPAERGQRLLSKARRDKPLLQAAAARIFAQMGIAQAPMTPDQLRQMMAASGIRSEDNLFSRGIQEMRNE